MNGLRFAIALLLTAPAAASPAQELGRLFFSPHERAALDARRKAQPNDAGQSPGAAPRRTRVDGYVLRSEGESTVWLNGAPRARETRIARDREGFGRVAVPGRAGGLRVGESYDGASGEVADLLRGGELRVVPAPKRAP